MASDLSAGSAWLVAGWVPAEAEDAGAGSFSPGGEQTQGQSERENHPLFFHMFSPFLKFLGSVFAAMAKISSWLSSTVSNWTKIPVRADAIPNLWSGQRSKPDLIQVGLHIQQQSAAGHIVHLQDVILQRTHRCNVTSAQLSLLLSVRNPRLAEEIHRTTVVYGGFLLKDVTKG
ncbi:MAG: hypothetical protein V8S71_08950 [Oscillospiraceae bacterium]